MDRIIGKIEALRLELNKLSLIKQLADRELIETSQQLDEVLNQYNMLLKQKSEN
ncbi:aspartyl-phosphate phosphatase Spo0E family protein [Paenibacillus sp. IHBB 10380]|uniref:aspartyl-phosphate phosphatase Spo0E family protein n=1 Tax=Paenibacillus sp. IHBB 10380 TaxID=1566358 RepID=UPI000AFC5F99|nr:aspartyl-phosphate phosphatase Spo0E family protein [Paenibacillus sp. IHBB 10380]